MNDFFILGDEWYKAVYSNGDMKFLYAYGAGIKGLDSLFLIQGQYYIIRNNAICLINIDNNLLTDITPIVYINAMQYIGASPLTAYFYSAQNNHIYTFSGNRQLEDYADISDYGDIKKYKFIPDINTLILLAENKLLLIQNDNYAYSLEYSGNEVFITDTGLLLLLMKKLFYSHSIMKILYLLNWKLHSWVQVITE